jgi:hypothetical protein
MRIRDRWLQAFCALALLGAGSAPALAQPVRDKILTENPSRTPGGSCIYGADGKLIFAPRGSVCPQEAQPPASAASSAEGEVCDPPQALAAELSMLAKDRAHAAEQLARLREAAAYEDREAAQRVSQEALAQLALHLDREQRVLARLVQPPASAAKP